MGKLLNFSDNLKLSEVTFALKGGDHGAGDTVWDGDIRCMVWAGEWDGPCTEVTIIPFCCFNSIFQAGAGDVRLNAIDEPNEANSISIIKILMLLYRNSNQISAT